MDHDLAAGARALVAALDALDTALRVALEADDVPDDALAALLAILDRTGDHDPGAQQRIAAIVRRLTGALGRRLPFKQKVVFEGVGVLERSMTNRSYAWEDGRRLAHLIAARAADERDIDPETGEVLAPPPAVIAARVADALIACGGLDNRSAPWRKEQIQARGIDPADWRVCVNEGTRGARWMD